MVKFNILGESRYIWQWDEVMRWVGFYRWKAVLILFGVNTWEGDFPGFCYYQTWNALGGIKETTLTGFLICRWWSRCERFCWVRHWGGWLSPIALCHRLASITWLGWYGLVRWILGCLVILCSWCHWLLGVILWSSGHHCVGGGSYHSCEQTHQRKRWKIYHTTAQKRVQTVSDVGKEVTELTTSTNNSLWKKQKHCGV